MELDGYSWAKDTRIGSITMKTMGNKFSVFIHLVHDDITGPKLACLITVDYVGSHNAKGVASSMLVNGYKMDDFIRNYLETSMELLSNELMAAVDGD